MTEGADEESKWQRTASRIIARHCSMLSAWAGMMPKRVLFGAALWRFLHGKKISVSLHILRIIPMEYSYTEAYLSFSQPL